MNFTYLTIFPKWRSSGMKLFDKIRILRKARGLSQEQLGYSLSRVNKDGISRQTISDWENGKFEPKLDNIRDLAEVFNVSFDALLDEDVDLNDEQVLQAVLNQQSYKVKQEVREEVKVEETPAIKRCKITIKEIILLLIIGYSLIAGVFNINNFVQMFIIATEQSTIIAFVVELVIELAFLGLFGTAFAFLLPAIYKRKMPKITLILLLVAFGLSFAIMVYSDVVSIIHLASRSNTEATRYYYNNYLTTYERSTIGIIVSMILSFITSTGFIVLTALIFRSYLKQKQVEKIEEKVTE